MGIRHIQAIRSVLLGGAALTAMAGASLADGAPALGSVDIDQLAATSAPVLPSGSRLITISKTPQLEVPGLAPTPGEKARMGDTATTLRILPSSGAAGGGSISWSGYSSVGVIYNGSK